MLRGIYAAASGMVSQYDNINIYANNIANASTHGFKRSELVTRPFADLMIQLSNGNASNPNDIGSLGLGVGTSFAKLDTRQGALEATANPLNVGIQGDGFFQVEATQPDGSTTKLTTRNGAFLINTDRQLVNAEGHRILGENDAPIVFNSGQNVGAIRIREDGTVIEGSDVVGKIKMVKIQQLEQAILDPRIPRTVANVQVTGEIDRGSTIKQNFLESSNVEIIREMIGLISSSKSHDTSQRLIATEDKSLDRAINEMGRIQ